MQYNCPALVPYPLVALDVPEVALRVQWQVTLIYQFLHCEHRSTLKDVAEFLVFLQQL